MNGRRIKSKYTNNEIILFHSNFMAKYLAKLEFMEFCYFCYNSHDANDFVVYKRIIDAENKGNARIEARRIKGATRRSV